jgi:hypothetical protein
MKCFTAQQSPDCCVGIGRADCGPEDHPREPHSRPKQRAQTRCSLAAAVRLKVASEELPGAEWFTPGASPTLKAAVGKPWRFIRNQIVRTIITSSGLRCAGTT